MRSCFKILFFLLLIFFCTSTFCLSATYYVDSDGGNDSNTGLSHAQAWKTISKVNGTKFSKGDDVYFRCGGIWTNQSLYVDWSGTPSNSVIIGAYHMSNGVETIGVNEDGKPIVDGNNVFPSSDYGFLVGVGNEKEYITIQDLYVKRSAQYGIKFTSGAIHGHVQRCKVDETYRENIYFAGGSNYGKVEYCELSRGSKMRLKLIGECRGWPPGGIRMPGTNYGIIQYNWIYNQYAEGINAGHNSTIRYNLIGDTTSVGIYVQSQHGTEVAYNLIYGTDTDTYNNYPSCSSSQADWKGNGIAVGQEVSSNYGDLYDIKVHHNIVINRMAGIRIYNSHETAKLLNVDIYNNTLIDNKYSFNFTNRDDKSDGEVSLSYNLSYTKHDESKHLNVSGESIDNWKIDNNHWAIKSSPTGVWSGEGDQTLNPNFLKEKWKGTNFKTSDLLAENMMPVISDKDLVISNKKDEFIDSNSTFYTTNPDSIIGDPIEVFISSQEGSYTWPMGAVKTRNLNSDIGSLYPPKGIIAF